MQQASFLDTQSAPFKLVETRAVAMARQLLADDRAIIIDTETTGLTQVDEVIQVAIVDMSGAVLLDTLVKPYSAEIHPGAQAVHGIAADELVGAPALRDLGLLPLLDHRIIVAYNAGFDKRLLVQSAAAWGDTPLVRFLDQPCWTNLKQPPVSARACWVDLMKPYADHWGQPVKNGYKWQSLENACIQQGVRLPGTHRALEDALLTLALLRRLAEGPEVRYR